MKLKFIFGVMIFVAVSCTDKDLSRKDFFKANGVVIQRDRVIAWFPKDSIPDRRMNEIVDTLNLQIRLADKLIGGPAAWQKMKEKPIPFYFCPGYFISYASKGEEIFIPLIRVRKNKAPWLHETMHILLRSNKGNWHEAFIVNSYFNMPQWLIEGMAEYGAVKIANDHHLPKVDLFRSGGYKSVDSVCKVNLAVENSANILKYIGRGGAPTELSGEKRATFAPTFYNCSCSFTKYLAETYGMEKMVTAISEFQKEEETIELLTHKTMADLKQEWLSKLEIK